MSSDKLEDSFCIDYYRVNGIDTAYYVSDFISSLEEENLLSNIYAAPKPKWTQLTHRRLQNWGGIPHKNGMIAETIPPWLQTYLDKIHELNMMGGNKPNHVLVNEYLPGQGIYRHRDGCLFYPTITTISLKSALVLKFLEPRSENSINSLRTMFSFILEPRSLLIIQDKLFTHYLHTIEEVEHDDIDDKVANLNMCSGKYAVGDKLKRDTRVSMTIRHVPKTTSFKLSIGNK